MGAELHVLSSYAMMITSAPFPLRSPLGIGRIHDVKPNHYGVDIRDAESCAWLCLLALRYACGLGVYRVVQLGVPTPSLPLGLPLALHCPSPGCALCGNLKGQFFLAYAMVSAMLSFVS